MPIRLVDLEAVAKETAEQATARKSHRSFVVYNAIIYNTILYNTIQYNKIQYNAKVQLII